MASEFDVIVVGGGAAGMISAGTAASCGKRVLLLEKNRELGRKLRITGKGRCNVTNACDGETFLRQVPTGGKFLYSAIRRFSPEDAMAFFEEIGVPLKTERGNRAFPASDRAADVAEALADWMRKQGVTVRRETAKQVLRENGAAAGVATERERYLAPRVILATGGLSYPATGSTGDGYAFARAAGHTVTECSGALVPLEVEGGCKSLAGLSLRNTGVRLWNGGKKPVYQDFGELTFLHYGLSGPTILSCSCHMEAEKGPYEIELDLKPALGEAQLDARILRDFSARQNEPVYQGIRPLLPGALVPVVLDRAGVAAEGMVRDVTKQQRRAILETVKHLRFPVAGKRPVAEAIVTHGGVRRSEVHPGTMESKLCRGLYFAGEILDLDAYTGGFNLQIAWSTGVCAGSSCGNSEKDVL